MIKKSFLAFFVVLICAALNNAQADTPTVTCGVPDPAKLETDPGGEYCDIYTRQLAYAEEAKKMNALLKERQANFGKPTIAAERKYRKDMKAYHGYDDSESEPQSANESAKSEIFGPLESGEPGPAVNP